MITRNDRAHFIAAGVGAGGVRHAGRWGNDELVGRQHPLRSEPVTIQLRYLQTLTEIGVEKNTTIVFPIPLDILSGLATLVKPK